MGFPEALPRPLQQFSFSLSPIPSARNRCRFACAIFCLERHETWKSSLLRHLFFFRFAHRLPRLEKYFFVVTVALLLACENIRFSSLFAARRNGCFRRLHQHATNSFCSNVAKKVARFFAHFTVPLWHRAHCTCVPARVKFRLQFYLLVSNFLFFVI